MILFCRRAQCLIVLLFINGDRIARWHPNHPNTQRLLLAVSQNSLETNNTWKYLCDKQWRFNERILHLCRIALKASFHHAQRVRQKRLQMNITPALAVINFFGNFIWLANSADFPQNKKKNFDLHSVVAFLWCIACYSRLGLLHYTECDTCGEKLWYDGPDN